MSKWFGICSPASVQSQIVPRKYTVGIDGEDQTDNNSPKSKVDVVRLKPQTQSQDKGAAQGQSFTVEDELFLFMLDVKYKHTADVSFSWLGSTIDSLDCYVFEQSDNKLTSGLVIILRETVAIFTKFHSNNSSTVGLLTQQPQQSTANNSTTIHSLSSACKSLTHLFTRYLSEISTNAPNRNSNSGGASNAVSPRTGNKPYTTRDFGAHFHSIENILIVAVSTRLNCNRFHR